MTWSRRTVLRALGTSAAGWPLASCGGAAGPHPTPQPAAGAARPRELADIRDQLAELVAGMTAHADARAFVSIRRQQRLRADDLERSSETATAALAVFTAVDANGRLRERGTANLSADGLAAAAAPLLAGARAARVAPDAPPAAELHAPLGDETELAEILRRAARIGDSRIVYRAAEIERWDEHRLAVGRGGHDAEHRRGGRASALFVAALGPAIVAETAQRSAPGEPPGIDDALLARTADGALAQLTVRTAPVGELDLVLDAPVTAMLMSELVEPAVRGDRWLLGHRPAQQTVASDMIQLADDPRATGALGARRFDDEGAPTRRVGLIEGGRLLGPLTDAASAAGLEAPRSGSAVRDDAGRVQARASHLVMAPGASEVAALVADVERGMFLEGPLSAVASLPGWHAELRCARGLEITGGVLTGRRFGPVALVGSVPSWLLAARGRGNRSAAIAAGPLRSVAAPALLLRGQIAPG